jgi:uncharacterized protein (DUF433 family)
MYGSSVAVTETEIIVEGDYEYLPLGQYVVAAVGVCGGRPTIKGHRLDARHIQALLVRGDKPQAIAQRFNISLAAVDEVAKLAGQLDYEKAYV